MMNLKEVRANARERMKGYCKVCPECDGKACAGQLPGMGGIGTGASFIANVAALQKLKLKMRLIHGVTSPDTSCSLFGMTLALPVLAAPIGGVSFNMGGQLPEDVYDKAVVEGCRDARILACTGDGAPDFVFDNGIAAIEAAGGAGIPFIKPWENPALFAKMERAANAGCKAVGVDIDAAGIITLAKMGRPVFPRTPDELTVIADKAHSLGMKFILKGLMCPEDTVQAKKSGCDAIVVSNHGGRALDATPGTAEVLPSIAKVAEGMTVLVDGGIRSGNDILKMLALGADAVLIGRPIIIGAMGGEKEGVRETLGKLKRGLISAMILTGCPSVREAGEHLLV